MKLSRKDTAELQGHLKDIFEILAGYESEVEPFDQIDRINAKVHDIEAALAE